jgi:hypothetical protein
VKGARGRISIIALILFAAYSLYVVAVAISEGNGKGPVFWASIGAILLLAALALWVSRRIYRWRLTIRDKRS